MEFVIKGETLKINDYILFDNLDISIKGDKISLTGNNGVGKTTLLSRFYEQSHADIFFVHQHNTIFEGFTVIENLKIMTKNQFDELRFMELMKFFVITHLKNKNIQRLSGGQIQLVMLCIAFSSHKKIIFLDEIENSLDKVNVNKVYDLLNTTTKEFIIVSHSNKLNFKEVNLNDYVDH